MRHHGDLARLEVSGYDLPQLADPELRRRVGDALRDVGFERACLDLEGYRRGALNEALDVTVTVAERGRVERLGPNGEVAVIRATDDESVRELLERRAAVVAQQRAAGFRFVALALDE